MASLPEALGLESATLIGGSMGGFFAPAATLAHPGRVRRLVLVGCPAGAMTEISEGLRRICGTPGLAEEPRKGRDTLEARRSQYQETFHVDPATVQDLAGHNHPSGGETTGTGILRRHTKPIATSLSSLHV